MPCRPVAVTVARGFPGMVNFARFEVEPRDTAGNWCNLATLVNQPPALPHEGRFYLFILTEVRNPHRLTGLHETPERRPDREGFAVCWKSSIRRRRDFPS